MPVCLPHYLLTSLLTSLPLFLPLFLPIFPPSLPFLLDATVEVIPLYTLSVICGLTVDNTLGSLQLTITFNSSSSLAGRPSDRPSGSLANIILHASLTDRSIRWPILQPKCPFVPY